MSVTNTTTTIVTILCSVALVAQQTGALSTLGNGSLKRTEIVEHKTLVCSHLSIDPFFTETWNLLTFFEMVFMVLGIAIFAHIEARKTKYFPMTFQPTTLGRVHIRFLNEKLR